MTRHGRSIQDAKNRFSEVVEAARREPHTVTKHGKPAVVVIAAAEHERLRRLERLEAPIFVDHLLVWMAVRIRAYLAARKNLA